MNRIADFQRLRGRTMDKALLNNMSGLCRASQDGLRGDKLAERMFMLLKWTDGYARLHAEIKDAHGRPVNRGALA